MTDKLCWTQIGKQPLIKPLKTFSYRPAITSVKKQIKSPPTFQNNLNVQTHNSLPNLTKHGNDSKSFRMLTQNNNNKSTFRKPSEEIHEQNSTLKLKINSLKSALGKQRVRKQIDIKNTKKLYEKINTQYSQQYLPFDNCHKKSHLVQGVKYQYYALKQKYQQKCIEFDEMLKKSNAIQNLELKIYCEALENENKMLKQRVAKMLTTQEELFKEMQFQQCMEIGQDGGVQATEQWKNEQRQNIQELLGVSSKMAMLEQQTKDATLNIEKMQQKISIQRHLLRDRKEKIHFLQGIIKRKCNQLHMLRLQSQKQAIEKENIIKKLNSSIQWQQKRHALAIQALNQKNKRQINTQKDICNRYLKERQVENEGLRKEIKRLSLLLSSMNNHSMYSQEKEHQNVLKEFELHQKYENLPIDNFQFTFQKDLDEQFDEKTEEVLLNDSRQIQCERQVKRSNNKHSQTCIKVRPIKLSDIQYIKRQLRYRLIFNGLEIDEAKEYFSFNQQQSQEHLSKNEQVWLKLYISYHQIKRKLMNPPFCLIEQQANLVSRYMVEDQTNKIVYFHEQNQVQRSVAKSIFRSYVGDYLLPDINEAKAEIQAKLNKEKNLLSALSSFAPKGIISDMKLRQISQSIQIHLSESAWIYIISQLHSTSRSILQLEYLGFFRKF